MCCVKTFRPLAGLLVFYPKLLTHPAFAGKRELLTILAGLYAP